MSDVFWRLKKRRDRHEKIHDCSGFWCGRPGNDNPQRSNTIGGFGHYEEEMVKVNGKWFFTKRKIYNEGSARWQYKGTGNPAW
jgi:hypothetical protein